MAGEREREWVILEGTYIHKKKQGKGCEAAASWLEIALNESILPCQNNSAKQQL